MCEKVSTSCIVLPPQSSPWKTKLLHVLAAGWRQRPITLPCGIKRRLYGVLVGAGAAASCVTHSTAQRIVFPFPFHPLISPYPLCSPPPSAIRARFVDYSWCLRHTCYAVRKCSENLSIKKCLISEGQSIYEMSID